MKRKEEDMAVRLEAADAVCQELRLALSEPVWKSDWSRIAWLLDRWMRVTPKKIKYGRS